MEIEGEDGTKLVLKTGVKAVFGRGAGFNTEDLTVSRRHVSLEFKPAAAGTERSESDRVFFEVLGRNPVWIKAGESGDKIRTLRKSEAGEIAAGDQFCVSGHIPIWFTLKRCDQVMEDRALDGESELGSIDISDIDPVKEFGFLVIGKEFDQYPKSRMPDVKQWEWFLDDSTNGNSDDEDGGKKERRGLSKKRRRNKGNEDDDWSVESEEDKELMVKSKRVMTPTYSTRSKKTKKDSKASSSSSSSSGAQTKQRGRVDVEDDDDDDETLGGFIVSDEEAKLEEEDESNVDEEEEEDSDEDEDEE